MEKPRIGEPHSMQRAITAEVYIVTGKYKHCALPFSEMFLAEHGQSRHFITYLLLLRRHIFPFQATLF